MDKVEIRDLALSLVNVGQLKEAIYNIPFNPFFSKEIQEDFKNINKVFDLRIEEIIDYISSPQDKVIDSPEHFKNKINLMIDKLERKL